MLEVSNLNIMYYAQLLQANKLKLDNDIIFYYLTNFLQDSKKFLETQGYGEFSCEGTGLFLFHSKSLSNSFSVIADCL